jgi:hypothetical protein
MLLTSPPKSKDFRTVDEERKGFFEVISAITSISGRKRWFANAMRNSYSKLRTPQTTNDHLSADRIAELNRQPAEAQNLNFIVFRNVLRTWSIRSQEKTAASEVYRTLPRPAHQKVWQPGDNDVPIMDGVKSGWKTARTMLA